MDNEPTYLMTPQMHAQLSFVRGFNDMNGSTYQEYIIKALRGKLNVEQREKVLSSLTIETALDMLIDMKINYTHVYIGDTVP